MQILLELRSGPNAGTKIPLKPGQLLRIGRHPQADQSIPDDKRMSSLHFGVEYSEKGCRLLDLKSSNGTFLNGARVRESVLVNGDEIRAGGTIFAVHILPDAQLGSFEPRPKTPTTQRRRAKRTPTPISLNKLKPPAPLAPSPGSRSNRPLLPGELPSFPFSAPKFDVPPVAQAEPTPDLPAPRQPSLLDLFAKDFQPLFALLDASREPSVLKVILESKEEYQSLYEGPQGAQLAHFAPYLIRVPQKSPLLETLVQQAWSKSWGVFLTCDKPLKDLRTHFRHFLTVKLPDGQQVYFRYYDPRVLRLFLPTCLPEETTQFFGPVKHFLIEAEDPATALHFTCSPKGADKKELQLASS
jgi:pSer/pThr/pTyr-binding forkhead associated (FHA) protein